MTVERAAYIGIALTWVVFVGGFATSIAYDVHESEVLKERLSQLQKLDDERVKQIEKLRGQVKSAEEKVAAAKQSRVSKGSAYRASVSRLAVVKSKSKKKAVNEKSSNAVLLARFNKFIGE